MPSISISEYGEGATRFESRLLALEHNLDSIPLAAAEVMESVEKYVDVNWGRGVKDTAATDKRWPDHSPLYNTGTLKASLTDAGAEGAIRDITPYGFTFGTSLHYAKFLARGTKRMAAKPVIPDVRAVRAVCGAAMRAWLLRDVEI